MKTIRQLREEHNLTQLALANKLGVTPSTIYNWEAGRFEPKAMQLRAVARAFGVSSDDIELMVEQASKKAA
jgi:transcriptional regulator with XRE-family HTH domain